MRRRLVAIAAALGIALASVGSVSADTLGTGQFLSTESATACSGNLCTTASVFVGLFKGGDREICLTLSHTDSELGGVEYEREDGCTDTPGAITKSKGGFIVAFAATGITLESSLGGSRSVTISDTYAVTSTIVRSTTVDVFDDSPQPGCTTTATTTARTVTVSGTLNVGATAFDDAGTSVDQAYRTKTRC